MSPADSRPPTESPHQMWGGRFALGPAEALDALNRSLPVDHRLWPQDVTASKAWVHALGRAAVLSPSEESQLLDGLDRVGERLADGAAVGAPDEDIHTLVERLLYEEVGAVAGKLHTGRSRNDQCATDLRLWTLDALDQLDADIAILGRTLVGRAQDGVELILPGYTHGQRAQPVRWAYVLLAHAWPLVRDRQPLGGADHLRQRRVRIRQAVRRLQHGLEPDAAEAQPGRVRAGARQVGPLAGRPRGAARHTQGVARGLPEGPAGRQSPAVRRVRYAQPGAAGGERRDRVAHARRRAHGGGARRLAARDRSRRPAGRGRSRAAREPRLGRQAGARGGAGGRGARPGAAARRCRDPSRPRCGAVAARDVGDQRRRPGHTRWVVAEVGGGSNRRAAEGVRPPDGVTSAAARSCPAFPR